MYAYGQNESALRIERARTNTFKWGYKIISAWNILFVRAQTKLLWIPCRSNKNVSMKIIEAQLLPFVNEVHSVHSQFVLQEENCGHHSYSCMSTYMKHIDLNPLKWSSKSPNLRSWLEPFLAVEILRANTILHVITVGSYVALLSSRWTGCHKNNCFSDFMYDRVN